MMMGKTTTPITAMMAGLLLLGTLAPPLAAQGRPGRANPPIRQQIEQRFMQKLISDLQLTDDQGSRLGAVLGEWGARRATLEQEERQLRAGIAGQLRPGIAADADAVSRMIDELLANRVAYAASFQGEMAALTTILSPVQRGQFLLARDQLLSRARDLMQQRQPPPGRQ
jgi:hypothetical protein